MGTVIVTALITILSIFALIHCIKDKNFLGLGFSFLALAVFGFFTVATIITGGIPTAS